MSKYEYVGSGNWGSPERSCFLIPVFANGKKYFIQKIVDEKIQKFIEISAPEPEFISKSNKKIERSKKDKGIYCFNVKGTRLIEGDKSQIEIELAQLLRKEDLNVHSKFLIANFLNLYLEQIELIEEVNKELEDAGISNRIPIAVPFEDKIKARTKNFFENIKKRMAELNKVHIPVRECDLGFVHGQWAYFKNSKFNAATVFNKTITTIPEKDKMMGDILKKSIDIFGETNRKEMIKNLPVYEYMMCSSVFLDNDIALAQSITTRPNKSSGTIIMDSNIRIEKQYQSEYGFKKVNEATHLKRSESIASSVFEITSSFSQTKTNPNENK